MPYLMRHSKFTFRGFKPRFRIKCGMTVMGVVRYHSKLNSHRIWVNCCIACSRNTCELCYRREKSDILYFILAKRFLEAFEIECACFMRPTGLFSFKTVVNRAYLTCKLKMGTNCRDLCTTYCAAEF